MKKVLFSILIIIVIFCAGVSYLYNVFWGEGLKNTENYELYIPSGASYEDVQNHFLSENLLINPFFFDVLANRMNYKKEEVKSGRYILPPKISLRDLISKLRTGNQDPVNVTFNNIRTIEELAGRVARQIEMDSLSLLYAFFDSTNQYLKELTKESLPTLFIPNTYQLYWNVKAQEFINRMGNEHEKYWTSNRRKEKAKALNITPTECSILASIVQQESNLKSERPIIAGVYLNRLKRGMPLQADPTVVFAIGDFTINRVLNDHLLYRSPYNTYLNAGLPPGPICLPESSSIDAVLNAEDHNYIYFCAKPGYDGGHLFAKNLIQHNKNARTYQSWLNREGIMR